MAEKQVYTRTENCLGGPRGTSTWVDPDDPYVAGLIKLGWLRPESDKECAEREWKGRWMTGRV